MPGTLTDLSFFINFVYKNELGSHCGRGGGGGELVLLNFPIQRYTRAICCRTDMPNIDEKSIKSTQ